MTATEPKLDQPDVGSPDDLSHYARKADVDHAIVHGGTVTALCGVQFLPLRDPQRYPVCQRCAELLEQLGNRNLS